MQMYIDKVIYKYYKLLGCCKSKVTGRRDGGEGEEKLRGEITINSYLYKATSWFDKTMHMQNFVWSYQRLNSHLLCPFNLNLFYFPSCSAFLWFIVSFFPFLSCMNTKHKETITYILSLGMRYRKHYPKDCSFQCF